MRLCITLILTKPMCGGVGEILKLEKALFCFLNCCGCTYTFRLCKCIEKKHRDCSSDFYWARYLLVAVGIFYQLFWALRFSKLSLAFFQEELFLLLIKDYRYLYRGRERWMVSEARERVERRKV